MCCCDIDIHGTFSASDVVWFIWRVQLFGDNAEWQQTSQIFFLCENIMEINWVYWYWRSQLVTAQLTGAVFLEGGHREEPYQKRWEAANALFPSQVGGNASKANGTISRKWLCCLSSNHVLYDILAWSRERPWTSFSQEPPESCWQMLEPTQLSTKVKQEWHVLVPDHLLCCHTMKQRAPRTSSNEAKATEVLRAVGCWISYPHPRHLL